MWARRETSRGAERGRWRGAWGGVGRPLAALVSAALIASVAAAAAAQDVFQRSVQRADTTACATEDEVAAYADRWLNRRPARALGVDGDLDDAFCTQELLVDRLRLTLGEPIGYVVGLTSDETQALFNTDRPIRGVALEGMLLDNDAAVPERFGYWPFIEADLLIVVGSEKINQARTPLEVLRHVRAVRPFIGLVDIGVDPREPVTPITLTAQNTGARFGVLGRAIPLEPTEASVRMLAELEVTLESADGAVLSKATGESILGNPLNSVLWLIEEGVTLKRGEMVNLGSFGLLSPASAAKGRAVATYRGLPGAPQVRVRLTPASAAAPKP
ncbi:MAG: hydratase [Pseudomonadota bacterium]